jgi:hypothetical protein
MLKAELCNMERSQMQEGMDSQVWGRRATASGVGLKCRGGIVYRYEQ